MWWRLALPSPSSFTCGARIAAGCLHVCGMRQNPSWPAVAWVKSVLDVVGDYRPGSRAYHNSGVTAMRMRYSAATETTLADWCRVTQYHFAAVRVRER